MKTECLIYKGEKVVQRAIKAFKLRENRDDKSSHKRMGKRRVLRVSADECNAQMRVTNGGRN